MIKFLSKWIEGIIIAISIVSIIEMILPNGNIKKYIKIILSIYVIFSIISPFVDSNRLYNLATNEFNSYVESSTDNKDFSQINTSNTYKNLYMKELENDLKERIKEYGYYTKKCDIDAVFDTIQSNSGINKINLVISKNRSLIEEVNQIQKVEINEKDKAIETSLNIKNNEQLKKIKKELSQIYEIDESIIYISEE